MNSPVLLASDPVLVNRFRRFSQAAAAIAAAVGALVLLGWTFDLPVVKSVLPGQATMKPNTALAFLLMGLSLGALTASNPSKHRTRTGEIAAGLTGAIGLATLLQYSLGWDLGIDGLLFNGSGPPRMSPTTAGSLLAMGFALLLVAREKNGAARFIGSFVSITSLVAVLGYLYRVPALHRLPGYGSMALHTALTLLVTALGLMLLRPERLAISARNSGGILLRRLFPAMVIALVFLGWLQIETQRAQLTNSASGVSMMVVIRMVVLSGLIAWTASSLRKVERGRVAAEHALRDLNLELEDRVRARTEELAASEKRAAAIIATSADGFVSFDSSGRIIDWNRQAELIFGWKSHEILGQRLTETIIPLRSRETFDAGLSRFLATGESPVLAGGLETTATHRDFREFPIELTVWATSDGATFSFNAFVKDITERKYAEHRLRESEERFRLLAETAPVGIYRWDSLGRCTYVNRAWTTITGLSSEQAAGDGWTNILHSDDSGHVLSARREATDNSGDLQLRYRIRTLGGAEKWVDSRAVAIKGDDLSILGYIGTMIDVTAQVQAEIAIASARDEALSASESKSQFLAMMSHEIRTPMNGVIGLTGLLLDTPLNATQRSYAEGVQVSGEALLGIINDILDFSKIEAGKLELEDEVFDLSNTVTRVAGLVTQPAHARGLQLVVECDPKLPVSVRGDEGRLRQILLNFATNAIKFTSIGRVTIRASVDPEQPEEGATIRFEVIDTGPGIAEDVARRLFQPFAQADASTTRRYGGTGLGLAICRQLATAMGGEVGLESRLGQGSNFWLRLPFAVAEPLAQTSEDSAEELPRPRALGRPGRILVVEDHPINQQVTQAYLEQLGYDSQIVQNGLEALAALEDEFFDAVLMDCHMPDMDGYQATAEVRRREGNLAHTPIIAMTASALEKDRGRCIAAGMDDYLAKPIEDGELERVLARWIPAA